MEAPKHSRTTLASVRPPSVQNSVTRTDWLSALSDFGIVKERKTDCRIKTNAVPQGSDSVGSELLRFRIHVVLFWVRGY